MPYLQISTNVAKSKITEEFKFHLTDVLVQTGKSKEFCSVHILPDQMITFGGSNEPCAYVCLMSIGKLGLEENKKLSDIIMTALEKKLGISPSIVFIYFIDPEPYQVGYNKTTFAEILK